MSLRQSLKTPINHAILTDRVTMTRRITRALVRGTLQGVVDANLKVLALDVEGGALKYSSPNLPAKLRIRWARKLIGEGDHLTERTVCTMPR